MPQPTRWSRLLYRLAGRLRCRIINGNHGEPYLERYHLFRLPGGGGVYLHRFVASDPDRGLHDHPWPWALSLVLSGGYREQYLETASGGRRVHERSIGPGRFNFLRGRDFHRVILPAGAEAWTCFAHGGKSKDWGFLRLTEDGEGVFQPHETLTGEGGHANWWVTAPRGRELRSRP